MVGWKFCLAGGFILMEPGKVLHVDLFFGVCIDGLEI
jgi:hypothetical protein